MIAAQMLISNLADPHTGVARNCPEPSRTEFGDFLRKQAQTRLRVFFRVCGLVWQVSTNSQSILKAAQETFDVIDKPGASLPFHIRFWVDGNLSASPPWPKPYVRGLDHLVFASFDCGSSVLIDLAGR